MLNGAIGHYRLFKILGAGGMGEVYLAYDSLLNRRIALKTLAPHRTDPHSLERFQREARSIAALNHPNIVTIYSVEEHSGLHFLTMELVEGKTLAELIPPAGMALDRLLEIAIPLADALSAAHERGIIHRDLKPLNVMVAETGLVKVLDFGIAKPVPDNSALLNGTTLVDDTLPRTARAGGSRSFLGETLTETGLIVGTPAYMSPEQVGGHAVDHRTDLFSFGVLLFEMATGRRPFSGKSRGEVFAAILDDTPPAPSRLNPRVPRELDDLIARCLQKDTSRRVQSARDLHQSLTALAEVTPADSRIDRVTRELRRLRRWLRPPVTYAVAGGIVLTLVTAGTQVARLLEATNQAAPTADRVAGRRPSLAVLPLGNFSNDPEYFVDGMTDALIASLSEVHGVRVISRQSVMRFKRSSEGLPQIAWKLGVDLVVHGSVMRVGNRVRITAQLIRAHPEQQIWARSYERDFRDALGLQADMAKEIAGEIQLRIEPGERRRRTVARTVDPEAYDAYLRGYFALNLRTRAGLATAREAFLEALRQDASFSLAHAGLAELYCIEAQFGHTEPAAAYRQARLHAQRALELDPDLADAHVSLGLVQLYADHDWDASEASFRRVVALRPSQPEVHHYYAIHLLARDRFKEGVQQLRLFLELDPLSPSANVNVGLVAYLEGSPDEALRLFNKARTLAPDFHAAYLKLSDFHRLRQDESRSYENFRKNLELRYPKIVPAVDLAQRKHGRRAALETAAKALEDEIAVNRNLPPEDIARVYVRLGDKKKAIDCLEESFRRGFPGALLFGATERWDWNTLRNEKRFQDLVQRIRSSRFPHSLSPSPRPPTAGCSKSAT